MLAWDTSSDDIDVGQISVYHHLFDVSAVIRLDRDVAVRAVDDASCLKTPTVVCHALDCRVVFAGEGHACQSAALGERIFPDARHAVGDRHACQATAFIERILPDARHIGSNFNSLRHFYPLVVIGIFSIQSGDFHRIQVYLSRPVIFLRSPVCKRYLRLRANGWFIMRLNPINYVLGRASKIYSACHVFFPFSF